MPKEDSVQLKVEKWEYVNAALISREATDNGEVNGPQQYGIWKVSRGVAVPQEDFIAIVFRGTWSTEDVVIDVNIRPTPLNPGLMLHS